MCVVNKQFEFLEFYYSVYDEIYLTFTAGSVCLCCVCIRVVSVCVWLSLVCLVDCLGTLCRCGGCDDCEGCTVVPYTRIRIP